MQPPTLRLRGFTLIELMVAIFITAIVFALGYGGINQAVNNRDALEERQERLLAVQTAMRVISQDINQITPRAIRDPSGNSYNPVVESNSNTQPFLQLTRGGWANPAGVQRPTVQRVAYFFENNELRREYWPVADPVLSVEREKRKLLTGVKSVTFKYMDVTRNWRDVWPPQSAVQGNAQANQRARPIAVEVTIELDDWGKIRRLFEVPG
jgi:general secretion pathway protein J